MEGRIPIQGLTGVNADGLRAMDFLLQLEGGFGGSRAYGLWKEERLEFDSVWLEGE